MTRLSHLTTTMAAIVLAVTLAAASRPGHEASPFGSWGSSLAIRDPDPGFWRAQPGERIAEARPYSAGMSSLAAMTRIEVAPGDDLELTNLGASGAILLESGALVLTNAEGSVALKRAGKIAGHDPGPAEAGVLLLRGDRLLFRSSATIAFRNPEARVATLLLATEIPELPSPLHEVRIASDSTEYHLNRGWQGPLRLAHEY